MTETTLDRTVLASLRADINDDGLVAEIIEAFLVDTPRQIASLAAADQRGDTPGVVALAHLIKGSALSVGAVGLVQLCAALESAPGGSERVLALAGAFDELSRSLSEYLGDLRGG